MAPEWMESWAQLPSARRGGGRPLDRRRRSKHQEPAGRPHLLVDCLQRSGVGPACRGRVSAKPFAAGGRVANPRSAGPTRRRGRRTLPAKAGGDQPILTQQVQQERLSVRRLPDQDAIRRLVDRIRRGLGAGLLGFLPARRRGGRRGARRPDRRLRRRAGHASGGGGGQLHPNAFARRAHRADAAERRVAREDAPARRASLRKGPGHGPRRAAGQGQLVRHAGADSRLRDRLSQGAEPPLHPHGDAAAGPSPAARRKRADSRRAVPGRGRHSRRSAAAAARRSPRRARGRRAVGADRHRRGGILPPYRHHRHDHPGSRGRQQSVQGEQPGGPRGAGLPVEHPQLPSHSQCSPRPGRAIPAGRRHLSRYRPEGRRGGGERHPRLPPRAGPRRRWKPPHPPPTRPSPWRCSNTRKG